jgi:hypothetical protein
MYRKPAAAKAKAYGKAPCALFNPKYATMPPSTEANPVAMFKNIARRLDIPA